MASSANGAGTPTPLGEPDIKVSVRQTFGIDSDLEVPAFSAPSEFVPDFDDAYRFDHDTTLAILAGFAFNRRGMAVVPPPAATGPASASISTATSAVSISSARTRSC